MNSNYVLVKLSRIPNGTWFKMGYVSDVPLLVSAQKAGHVVLKCTETTVRKGISYKNLKSVKTKIAEGYEYVGGALQWGHWKEGLEGLVIEHTDKSGKYKEYLRVYTSPNKPKVTYVMDGKVVSEQEVKDSGFVKPSYWNKKETPTECFTVNMANIQYIGNR